MMIRCTITGHERVRLPDGRELTGPGATYEAARVLIGEGQDPAASVGFARGDHAPSLTGTLHAFARLAWGGAERDPAAIRWHPHPRGHYPDALLRWHERSLSHERAARVVAARGKARLSGPEIGAEGQG